MSTSRYPPGHTIHLSANDEHIPVTKALPTFTGRHPQPCSSSCSRTKSVAFPSLHQRAAVHTLLDGTLGNRHLGSSLGGWSAKKDQSACRCGRNGEVGAGVTLGKTESEQ